jgi:hypothetical protein
MADETENKEKVTEDVFVPSTAQLDAERRVAQAEADANREENSPESVVPYRVGVNPSYGVEEGFGYVGTDPIYQNSAGPHGRPFKSDEDWQRGLMVEPSEDAGQVTLPYVPGARVGGPAVESAKPADHDWTSKSESESGGEEESNKSDSQEGDSKDEAEDKPEQPASKPVKSSAPAAAPKKSTSSPAK